MTSFASPHNLSFYPSEDILADTLATDIAEDLSQGLKTADSTLLVLPGGRSPRLLITRLAQTSLPWDNIFMTTTDERCVALQNPASNAGQIMSIFNREDIYCHIISLWEAGKANTKAVHTLPWPAQVVVLGMGNDGHIASLFPGNPCLSSRDMIMSSASPVPPTERVTLNLDTLLNTRRVILLVGDEQKWNLCRDVLNNKYTDLPLSHLLRTGRSIDIRVMSTQTCTEF